MSEADRNKWNRRYAEDSHRKSNPVDLLRDWLAQAPRGRALDVACGAGRNALYLAENGFEVDAIDISAVGLRKLGDQAEARGLSINCIEQDLDEPFEFDRSYQLIVVLWYVNLPLIKRLCDCLAPGGCLICEEHLRVPEVVIGPENPRFRVAPGALREAMVTLELLHYDESVETVPDGRIASARAVGRKAP